MTENFFQWETKFPNDSKDFFLYLLKNNRPLKFILTEYKCIENYIEINKMLIN